MKKNKIFAMLLSLACATGFVACEDDDTVLETLGKTEIENTAVSYNSLTFSWEKVDGAIQYGYQLLDAIGSPVTAGVIKETNVRLTGLQPDTEYTLNVWPFAGLNVKYDTPPAVSLKGKTKPIIKLEKPVVTMETGNGTATFSWDAVDGAQRYSYEIRTISGETVKSATTTATSVMERLSSGEYTLTVSATTTKGGFENSDPVTTNFVVEEWAEEIWRAKGTYTSEVLGDSWEAEIIAYNNGTFTIPAFYGVKGCDLTFTLDNGELTFLSGSSDEIGWGSDYWGLPTGDPAAGILAAYIGDSDYRSFSGSSAGGDLWFGYYYGADLDDWGYDEFEWSGAPSLTINDVVGTYSNYIVGTTWINDDGEAEDLDDEWYDVVIEKIDDTTISMDGIFWEEVPITGTFDASAGTITFEPQDYYGYTAAGEEKTDPIVATVNINGTINIPVFYLWYDGYTYLEIKASLTKITTKAASSSKMLPARKAPVKGMKPSSRR